MSNLERLVQAGVVDGAQISNDQCELINNEMSEAEVQSLIDAKVRLGDPLGVPRTDGAAL